MSSGGHVVRSARTTQTGFVLVSIYSWTMITWGVLLARFFRGSVIHRIQFGADDATAFAGHVIYIGAIVAWQYVVNAGLGRKFDTVSENDAALFSKALLAAQLLEVCAITLAKFSSALLMERVAPRSRKLKISLFTSLIVYCIFSTLAIAFRCGTPANWAHRAQRCGNSGLLVAAISLNLATDLILAVWLLPTLLALKFDLEKRMSAMLLFGSRSVVALAAGAQIWAALKAVSGQDPTRDTVDFAVISQMVTSMSLIVASLPRIKRILGVGGSGLLFPEIQASELTATRSRQYSVENGLKYIPSSTGRLSTTAVSKGSKDRDKKKGKIPGDWQMMVTLGSIEDEHASTSSLVERTIDQDGVMLERGFDVIIEENRKAEVPILVP